MAKQVRDSTNEQEVIMKQDCKEKVRGVTEEVRVVSFDAFDLTLVCKGGATVRQIICHLNITYHCHQVGAYSKLLGLWSPLYRSLDCDATILHLPDFD